MANDLILASGSKTRADLLRGAGVSIRLRPANVDEHAIREGLLHEEASHLDIADALAEAKARKISTKEPGSLVLGCDQVLSFENAVLTKPENQEDVLDQLRRLRGKKHILYSSAVLYKSGEPQWRHTGTVRLTMRRISDDYLMGYVERNWNDLTGSVGGYKIEAEGLRLFSRIEGSHYAILGLPLLELLNHLTLIGHLES